MRFCNERGITGTVAAFHCIMAVYVLFIDAFIYLFTSVCNEREQLIDGSPGGMNLLFYHVVLSCFWTVAVFLNCSIRPGRFPHCYEFSLFNLINLIQVEETDKRAVCWSINSFLLLFF